MTNIAPRKRTSGRRAWPFVLLAVLCILPVLIMAGSQYADGRENVSSRCSLD